MDELLKPAKLRETQLDAWPVVWSALFDFTPSSDDIVSIVSRAGLNVDWDLNSKEAFSHSTRKRAYRPRVNKAYSELNTVDRDTVLSLIVAELARKFPAHAEAIKAALSRVGWTLKAIAETTQNTAEPRLPMKRIKELQKLLLRQVLDGNEPPELTQYSEQDQVYNSALLINGGYVNGEAIQDGNGEYVSTVMIQLTSKGHDFLEETDLLPKHDEPKPKKRTSKKIFVSHSSADEDLAEALLDLLCAALPLRRADFLCTTVDGAKLRGGDDTEDMLLLGIQEIPAFLSLLSKKAVVSTYVLFELGARWGCKKHHIPLLAKGAGAEVLKKPLKAKNALDLSDENDVLQLVTDIAEHLDLKPEAPTSYIKRVRKVVEISRPPEKLASQITPQFRLEAKDAEIHGRTIQYECDEVMDNIGYWKSKTDFVTWTIEVDRPTSFSVVIEQACARVGGGRYAIILGAEHKEIIVENTASWESFKRCQLGRMKIEKAGKYQLKIEPIEILGEGLMNLRTVLLFS